MLELFVWHHTKNKDYFYQVRLTVKSFSVTSLHLITKICTQFFGDAAAWFLFELDWATVCSWQNDCRNASIGICNSWNKSTSVCIHHTGLPQPFCDDLLVPCLYCTVILMTSFPPSIPLGNSSFAGGQHKKYGGSCKGSGTHKEIKICLKIMKQSFVQKDSKYSKSSSI